MSNQNKQEKQERGTPPQKNQQQPARGPDSGSQWNQQNQKDSQNNKSKDKSKQNDLSSQNQKGQGSQKWDDTERRSQGQSDESNEGNSYNRTDLDQDSDEMDHDVNFDEHDEQTSNRGSVPQNFNKKNNPGTTSKR